MNSLTGSPKKKRLRFGLKAPQRDAWRLISDAKISLSCIRQQVNNRFNTFVLSHKFGFRLKAPGEGIDIAGEFGVAIALDIAVDAHRALVVGNAGAVQFLIFD